MSEFLLETKNLTKSFRGFTAVDKVNLKVRTGHIHALLGPNGPAKQPALTFLPNFLSQRQVKFSLTNRK